MTDSSGVRLALCGYGPVAVQVLEQALQNPLVRDVVLVTHEPGPGMQDIRSIAGRHGVPCTTESINTAELPFRPDVLSSVWYRTIIRPPVLEAIGGRAFNLHPSLLPQHRGCSSVPWAIIEGDVRTGVTAHYIERGVDTGPILGQLATPISPDDTQHSLYRRCQELSVRIWPQAFAAVLTGEPGIPQVGPGCRHPRGAPNGGRIETGWDEDHVERFIRAMTSPPLPVATYLGRPVSSLQDYRRMQAAVLR